MSAIIHLHEAENAVAMSTLEDNGRDVTVWVGGQALYETTVAKIKTDNTDIEFFWGLAKAMADLTS